MPDQPDWIRPTIPRADSRCIVSAGLGWHYRRLLHSTETHCAVHCRDTWRLMFDVLPLGCPSHAEKHYAFKIAALRIPINAGFRGIVWMDATYAPIASIEPLWEHIDRNGWYVSSGGSTLGEYASDAALAIYGISRDAAMDIPLAASGLVGLNMHNDTARQIWDGWERLCREGAFDGPHRNCPGEPGVEKPHGSKWDGWCSGDSRCRGHRHDEAALSFVLHSLGLAPVATPSVGDWSALGIARNVPDYDVVRMRQWILEHGGPAELCR